MQNALVIGKNEDYNTTLSKIDRVQSRCTNNLMTPQDVKICLALFDYFKDHAETVYIQFFAGFSIRGDHRTYRPEQTTFFQLSSMTGGIVHRKAAPAENGGIGSHYIITLLQDYGNFKIPHKFHIALNNPYHKIIKSELLAYIFLPLTFKK